MSLSIAVIIGSTRPHRQGIHVADWFMDEVKKYPNLKFELIDLEKVNLPFLDEQIPASAGQYQNEHTKKWANTISRFDGYVFITPEYNHGYPAALKNALDYLYAEWNKKPMATVSYGATSGGLRAVEQLRLVALQLRMMPVGSEIAIPFVWDAVSEKGVKPEYVKGSVDGLIEELQWWGEALKVARRKKKNV